MVMNMRDLVDRGRVMNDLFDAHPIGFNSDDIAEAFKNAPCFETVDVVRCRECRYYRHGVCEQIEYIMDGYFRGTGEVRKPNDFCSLGVKMDGGAVDATD